MKKIRNNSKQTRFLYIKNYDNLKKNIGSMKFDKEDEQKKKLESTWVNVINM